MSTKRTAARSASPPPNSTVRLADGRSIAAWVYRSAVDGPDEGWIWREKRTVHVRRLVSGTNTREVLPETTTGRPS